MNGSKKPQDPTDQMCSTCGLFFSKQGIKPHERSCDRDEPILPLDRLEDEQQGAGDPSEAPHPAGSVPSDGEGVALSPEGDSGPTPAADGGGAGLGLEGPPEPPTSTSDEPTEDVEDLDDDQDGGCPECGTDLEDITAGKTFALEDGRTVTTEPADEWCPGCEAIVDGEEVLV
jgi:hypothetical protein